MCKARKSQEVLLLFCSIPKANICFILVKRLFLPEETVVSSGRNKIKKRNILSDIPLFLFFSSKANYASATIS